MLYGYVTVASSVSYPGASKGEGAQYTLVTCLVAYMYWQKDLHKYPIAMLWLSVSLLYREGPDKMLS